MIRLRSLASDTLIYGLLSAGRSLVGLLLVPIYTRIFPPSNYGQIDTLNTVAAFLTLALTLGMDTAVALFFYDNKGTEDRGQMLSTALATRVTTSTVVALTLTLLAPWVSLTLFRTPETATAIRLAAWTAPVSALVGFLSELLRLSRRPWAYTALSLLSLILSLSLAIWFVAGLRWGVNGALAAPLIGSLVILPVGILATWRLFVPHLTVRWLKSLLRIGLPLVPAAFGGWLIAYSNRYFLLHYASADAVGLLAVGNKASAPLVLFTQAFLFAWGPFAFSLQKQENAREVYAKTFLYFWLVAGTLGLAASLYARELLLIFTTSAYVSGYLVTGLMVLQLLFDASYYIVSIGLILARRTNRLAISMPLAAASTLILNWLLVPNFGFVGAGVAGMASYAISLTLVYGFAQRAHPIPFEIGKVARLIALAVLVWLAGYRFAPPDLPGAILLKTGLMAAFLVALLLTRVIRLSEIRVLAGIARSSAAALLQRLPTNRQSNGESS